MIIFARRKWLADFGAWCTHLVMGYSPRLLIRSLLNASDDLSRSKANERLAYVLGHHEEVSFFRSVGAAGTPLSVRQIGLHNDLHHFATLPIYPLERITCPTLVIHGRADGNVPLAHAEFVAGTIANAELFAMEDCGHFIWVGAGAELNRDRVRAFLNRHAPHVGTEDSQKAVS
jgi:pimeloyl-ACP methyl ester carboxylesterase